MSGTTAARNHSVVLDEAECKGCTVCVTTCPAEAIRVRDGKARILEERCIDCGECIRRCPHHAKKARSDDLSRLTDPDFFGKFDYRIALPAPSFYGQFPERFRIADIHAALIRIGFNEVFPVSAATPFIAAATREFLDRQKQPDAPRPLISSSCPTIIKFIQIRFPTLLEHIVPVIAPMEQAGRLARIQAGKKIDADGKSGNSTIGVFFISPCAGKITEAKAPLGGERSSIDGVFSMKDIHIPLLAALMKPEQSGIYTGAADEIAWGRAGGEAEATVSGSAYSMLSVDGMDQCRHILESVEDGKLNHIDFLELMACTGGCIGGPLTVANPSLARYNLTLREKLLSAGGRAGEVNRERPASVESCLRTAKIPARSALLLDPDFGKAMQMMDAMEQINENLPGLDCGCCGAPNCHALAEDIVRGNASKTDCVIILKEQYRALIENGSTETP